MDRFTGLPMGAFLYVCAALTLSVLSPSNVAAQEDSSENNRPADPAQVARWIEALQQDDSYKLRLQAAVLLGRVSDDKAYAPLALALSKDSHYTVRAAAAMALANLGQPRALSSLLKAAAADPEPFVRKEAERALEKFAHEEALPYVVAAYNSHDIRVRQAALAYLGRKPSKQAEVVYLRALGDAPEIFQLARRAILEMPREASLKLLEAALDHRESSVRRGAIEALEKDGSQEAAALILRVHERDIEVDEVRVAARRALRELNHHLPLQEIVTNATNNPDKHSRAKSLKLLGVLGGEDALRVLTQALADEDVYVRGNAVMAIGELGNPKALSSLEALEHDPKNQRISHLVRQTVKQLRRKQGDRSD